MLPGSRPLRFDSLVAEVRIDIAVAVADLELARLAEEPAHGCKCPLDEHGVNVVSGDIHEAALASGVGHGL